VTDPHEIRKWSKISYGDTVEKKKKQNANFFASTVNNLLHGSKTSDEGAGDEVAGEKDLEDHDDIVKAIYTEDETVLLDGEPEWFDPNYIRRRTSHSGKRRERGECQSVFSVEKPEAKADLPKSDSAKLVLARTHFVLEHEDLLPAYHVFYSNSECIAVWAKTGRWSTLQAAVYLISSGVGLTKSSVMLTISVAAAHAVLIPALAVGGLAVVSAPLLFLKKSKEKWEKTTLTLNDEFWSRAEPEVFVEAIQYWAQLTGENDNVD